jgi:hypothetical protein
LVQKAVSDLYKEISALLSEEQPQDQTSRRGLSLLESCFSSNEKKIAPGAHGFEVQGAQPWRLNILRLVSKCATPPCTVGTKEKTSSLNKLCPLAEAIVPSQPGSRAKRIADIILCKDSRFRYFISDGSRGSRGPQSLLDEAVDQGMSHMSKSVYIGSNFSGPGVPTHATCLVGNMAAVQVLQLRLENVGTPDVCLVLYKSALFSLMSSDNYDKWAASAPNARKLDFDDFRELLFLEKDLVKTQMPSGFPVVLELQKRRMALFGPIVEIKGNILGSLLGTGSASLVFQHRCEDSQAVKVSRYGRTGDIANEISILRRLSKDDEQSPYIPELIGVTEAIEVLFGDVKWNLPACITTPVGVGLLQACGSLRSMDKCTWLQKVLTDLLSALTFMHKRSIFHRDVNPNNAIIVFDSSGNFRRAVLIDYSIAFDRNKEDCATGFWGTPNYSHRELFEFYPEKEFIPTAEHDLTSLGFTMSVLVNFVNEGGDLPWSRFVFPKTITEDNRASFKDTMEERYKKAVAVLDKIATDDGGKDISEHVKKLLENDEPAPS